MCKYPALIIILVVALPIAASAVTATLNPTDDVYVKEQFPNDNHNNYDFISVGNNDNHANKWENGLIKFDVSAYSGATINSATVRLYVYGSVSGPILQWYGRTRIPEDWSEGTVTWNNRPDVTDYTAIAGPSAENAWWTFTVTDWVQGFVNGAYVNYGFQIAKDNSDPGYFWMRSKEYWNSDYHPELVLDYTPGSAVESASLGNIKAAFK